MTIGSSKNNRENYPRKCFRIQEKETHVKFSPSWRLSANPPSNNRAQMFCIAYYSYCKTQIAFLNFFVSIVAVVVQAR